MTDYLHIIQNWATVSDGDCLRVKAKIYEIIPSWCESEKLGCVPAIDGQYVFYKDYHSFDEIQQCILYKNNEFILSDKSWRKYIPTAHQTLHTSTTQSIFNHLMTIVFFNYTGLYGSQISKQTYDGSTSFFLWFESKMEMDKCVQYCQVFNSVDNEIGDKETGYNFDSGKLMNRWDRWFNGEWDQMGKLGILDDRAYAESWNDPSTVYHERAYHITTCEQFIKELNDFKQVNFGCDICAKEDQFSNFFHCLDCINWVIEGTSEYPYHKESAYNECNDCHLNSTHSSSNPSHQVLPSTDPRVLQKYINLHTEVTNWKQSLADEYNDGELAKSKHAAETFEKLKLTLDKISHPDKVKIIDFIEANQKSSNDDQPFLVVKDPTLAFNIASIFGHMTVFTDPEACYRFLKTYRYSFSLLYLVGFDSEVSADIINICQSKYSAFKVMTTTDYIPPAINFISAIQTWDESPFDLQIIAFQYTGVSGLALKYYLKSNSEQVKLHVFWFQNKDVMWECRQYLQDLLDLDYNGNDIGKDDLKLILSSSPQTALLEPRKNQWNEGEFKNESVNEFQSQLPLTTLNMFSDELNYIQSNKVEKHFTRCC
jgi:hypothetical protein